jgi:DNA-binding LacI/PurR family transcriptional regulator
VAARAGVSKSLVSLVLQQSPSVSDKRREAVLKAAAELGYRANGLARRLVSGRTHTSGVVVTDLLNPFYAEVLHGINAEARGAAHRLLVVSGADLGEAVDAAEGLLELRVEGLVLLGSELPADVIERLGREVPVVVVGAGADRYRRVDTVVDNDYVGAKLAVEHLISLGHQRIAHLAAETASAGRARRAGYEAAMREAGLGRRIRVLPGDVTEPGGEAAARAALRGGRVTAMFAVNDLAAVGAYDAIEESGGSVPGTVSLVGYDNTFLARTHRFSLTTVNQPRQEMGELAMRMLLRRLSGVAAGRRLHMLPPTLIVRRSTAAPTAPAPRESVATRPRRQSPAAAPASP